MAQLTPNRIVLISRGRHDEAVADSDCWPGMMLAFNSSMHVIPHATEGGTGQLLVAEEDALRGADITQKLPSGDQIPFRRPAKGDELLMLLQNGQSVAANVPLMSAGDGTLMAGVTTKLYEIVAPSATVTNVTAETTFSNGSFALPANELQVGDVLHIRVKAFCIAENSTNTHRVRLYVGTTALADSTALQLTANDVVIVDLYLTVRTITASGTAIATGTLATSVGGTFTTEDFTVASFTLDSTAIETFKVTTLASAQSTGNQIRLDEYQIDLIRSGGVNAPVTSAEAINNSGGTGTSGFNTAAFIRVFVN